MFTVKATGNFVFDPIDKTKKHSFQSSWKKTVLIEFDGDICEYYAWFIKKRYSIILNRPLRGAHITVVSDSLKDLSCGYKTNEQINTIWNEVKNKWNGKQIEIDLDVSPKTSAEYWWLNVTEESRKELNSFRAELGLGKSYFGLHMTIGYIPDKMEEIIILKNGTEKRITISDNIVRMEHSKYIHNSIKKGIIK